jgi:hypothetical protein
MIQKSHAIQKWWFTVQRQNLHAHMAPEHYGGYGATEKWVDYYPQHACWIQSYAGS